MTIIQEAMGIMEMMPRKKQQIVLELLRAMNSRPPADEHSEKETAAKMKTAALGLAGLWKDHENDLSVEETVRNMRKGRVFDT